MSAFVGRERELDLLAKAVAAADGTPLLVLGPPRIGRTALLREFRRRRAGKPDAGGVLLARIPGRQAALSPSHAAVTFGAELALRCAEADGLPLDADRVGEPEGFKALEEFPVRAIADFAKAVASHLRGTRKGADVLLRATANLADVLGEERKCWVGLLLDDAGALATPALRPLLAGLAAAAAAKRHTVLIATARQGPDADALHAHDGPLAGARVERLGTLEDEAADALVLRLGSAAGVYPGQGVLERVHRLTGGHPFHIRAVMQAALAGVERGAGLSLPAVDEAFLTETLAPDGRIAMHCEALARDACAAAGGGTTARLALAALAEADRPTLAEVSARLRGGTRAFRPVAEAMLNGALFVPDGETTGARRFADPVMRFWCARAFIRERLRDLERPGTREALMREFVGVYRAGAAPVPPPNFRAVAALCAEHDVPGEFLGTERPVHFPRFRRIQGYAFQERDIKLYALEVDGEPPEAPWAALFCWRDVVLSVEEVAMLQRWVHPHARRLWLVARRGVTPSGAAMAREAGMWVSSEQDLEGLTRHFGAATLAAAAPTGGAR